MFISWNDPGTDAFFSFGESQFHLIIKKVKLGSSANQKAEPLSVGKTLQRE